VGTKIKALICLAIIIILFFIIIRAKIKSDKKRKSLPVSSAEREKNINNDNNESQHETIKPKGKQPYFVGIPSAVLALLVFIVALIVFIISDSIMTPHTETGLYSHIINDLIIAAGCFFIVRENPKSIWYVPLICNAGLILSSILEPDFWKSMMCIPICGGWVLSIIVSIIGTWMGKRKTISDNP